jgi:alanine dehydrogenase
VIVDVAIDQGGSVETSKPTTHEHPTYLVDGVVHYCVTNMPGAVARTSTYALTNATFPYILTLANKGYKEVLKDSFELRRALNVIEGQLTIKEVAETFSMPYREI